MMKTPGLICLLIFAPAWSSIAQEEQPECHGNAAYLLIGYEREGGFSDYLVRARLSRTQDIPCKFDPQPQDFRISELDKTYTDEDRVYRFVLMKDDLLVIEREEGSGVTASYLLLVDMKERKSSDELGNHSWLEDIDETGLSFWKVTDIKPTRKNCPKDDVGYRTTKYEHTRLMMFRKVKYDFTSRKVVESAIVKCVVIAD